MSAYTQALVQAVRELLVEVDREVEELEPGPFYEPDFVIERLREALKGYDRAHAGKAWYMALVGPSYGTNGLVQYGIVFIKALDLFHSQGGFREAWGTSWVPVIGHSVEDARRRACETLPNARPYGQQGTLRKEPDHA